MEADGFSAAREPPPLFQEPSVTAAPLMVKRLGLADETKAGMTLNSESPALPLSGCASGFHWGLGFTHF